MDKIQILLFAAAFAILGVRLYQKYMKKGKGKSASEKKPPFGQTFASSSKDDDYEPYSKR
jgi:uncharacterized membrane protein YebE (DUF533 family)